MANEDNQGQGGESEAGSEYLEKVVYAWAENHTPWVDEYSIFEIGKEKSRISVRRDFHGKPSREYSLTFNVGMKYHPNANHIRTELITRAKRLRQESLKPLEGDY